MYSSTACDRRLFTWGAAAVVQARASVAPCTPSQHPPQVPHSLVPHLFECAVVLISILAMAVHELPRKSDCDPHQASQQKREKHLIDESSPIRKHRRLGSFDHCDEWRISHFVDSG